MYFSWSGRDQIELRLVSLWLSLHTLFMTVLCLFDLHALSYVLEGVSRVVEYKQDDKSIL